MEGKIGSELTDQTMKPLAFAQARLFHEQLFAGAKQVAKQPRHDQRHDADRADAHWEIDRFDLSVHRRGQGTDHRGPQHGADQRGPEAAVPGHEGHAEDEEGADDVVDPEAHTHGQNQGDRERRRADADVFPKGPPFGHGLSLVTHMSQCPGRAGGCPKKVTAFPWLPLPTGGSKISA